MQTEKRHKTQQMQTKKTLESENTKQKKQMHKLDHTNYTTAEGL